MESFIISRENIKSINNRGEKRITNDGNYKISVKPLDEVFLKKNKNCFMKIDVEGHELMVLQGAKLTLEKHKPIVALEMHFKKDIKNNLDILELLEKIGYRQAYILKNRLFGSSNYFFSDMPISEFKNLPTRNYRMVLFQAPA